MKIVQFGLHYSPNVGDGIISECLGHAICEQVPDAVFRTVDISGRTGFGDVTVRNRSLALAVLGRLPSALRGRVVELRLKGMLDRVEPDWRAALAGADLAIVGGGQILSDADLNFCTKLNRVASVARGAGVPVAIHAAGVSRNWSARGTALFSALFDTDLRAVGLRDAPSLAAWQEQTGGAGPDPVLTRDPGLLAAACYGAPAGTPDRIGLCITDPAILAYHADSGVAGGGVGFFVDLALDLLGRGHALTLFCNGAAEDRAALERVARDDRLRDAVKQGRVVATAAPVTPAELAEIIAGCRAVIAHRLHACIVAYSYGRAIVGLGWDRKLESFFASVGADAGFVGANDATPTSIADQLEIALAVGVDPVRHAAVLAETRQAVAGLVSLVGARSRETG